MTFDSGCSACAESLNKWHFRSIFIILHPDQVLYVNVNSITSYFSMLIHAIWNLLKKKEGMQVFHTLCISTGKRGMMTSTFISRFSDKKFFLSMRKVLYKKPLFIFKAILLNGTDWAITNQIVSFQLSLLWGINQKERYLKALKREEYRLSENIKRLAWVSISTDDRLVSSVILLREVGYFSLGKEKQLVLTMS